MKTGTHIRGKGGTGGSMPREDSADIHRACTIMHFCSQQSNEIESNAVLNKIFRARRKFSMLPQ